VVLDDKKERENVSVSVAWLLIPVTVTVKATMIKTVVPLTVVSIKTENISNILFIFCQLNGQNGQIMAIAQNHVMVASKV